MHILIGNSFPLGLVARNTRIYPSTRDMLQRVARGCEIHSFWGHAGTLRQVGGFLGMDLTPRTPRPALSLDPGGWPVLDGISFRECWIVTPFQRGGGRPPVAGDDAPGRTVDHWRVLRMEWL